MLVFKESWSKSSKVVYANLLIVFPIAISVDHNDASSHECTSKTKHNTCQHLVLGKVLRLESILRLDSSVRKEIGKTSVHG